MKWKAEYWLIPAFVALFLLALLWMDYRQYANKCELDRRIEAVERYEAGKKMSYGVYYGVQDASGKIDRNR